jgi:hypothetical protein
LPSFAAGHGGRGLVGAVGREGVGLIAEVVQLALEERGAQADVEQHLVVHELAAVFGRDLVQGGDRDAVALAQDAAVRELDRRAVAVLAAEHVVRRRVAAERRVFAGLAVMGFVVGVGERGRSGCRQNFQISDEVTP